MKVNVELSRELKRKYRHKVGYCYNNAWSTGTKNNCTFVIGLTTTSGGLMRHAWNIIDDQIVDTSLARKDFSFEGVEYYPIFIFDTPKKKAEAIIRTTSRSMDEYDIEFEMNRIEEIEAQTGRSYIDVNDPNWRLYL